MRTFKVETETFGTFQGVMDELCSDSNYLYFQGNDEERINLTAMVLETIDEEDEDIWVYEDDIALLEEIPNEFYEN